MNAHHESMDRGNISRRLKNEIARHVVESPQKLTVRDVMQTMSRYLGVERRTVKGAIQQLVAEKTLSYAYCHGRSILEASLEKAVRISDRIVIKPPRIEYHPKNGEVVIEMEVGTAFGEGRHPTTRLVLGALDKAFRCFVDPETPWQYGLDVGTGTGVLAIALARLGVSQVLGTDIDPCALAEARHNILLNGLVGRVTIEDRPVESLTGGYGVVVANLAFPTIKGMSALLVALVKRKGLMILSGFRASALPSVRKTFSPLGVDWEEITTEKDWACVTLCKS